MFINNLPLGMINKSWDNFFNMNLFADFTDRMPTSYIYIYIVACKCVHPWLAKCCPSLMVLFDRICIKKNVLLQPAWLSPHVVMNLLGVGNACKNTWYRRPKTQNNTTCSMLIIQKTISKQWHKWQGGLLYLIETTQPGFNDCCFHLEKITMMTMFQISSTHHLPRYFGSKLASFALAVCWTFGITSMGREIVEHTDTF